MSSTPHLSSLDVVYDSYTSQAFEPVSIASACITLLIVMALIGLAFNLIVMSAFAGVLAVFLGIVWFAGQAEKERMN